MTEEQKQQLMQDFQSPQETPVVAEPGEPTSAQSTEGEQPLPPDNLAQADRILQELYAPFSAWLRKLSRKELERVMLTLVKFPFLEKHEMKLKTKEEKTAFMFGERLIYANMVKRARAELDRTFGEVSKEQTEEVISEEPKIEGEVNNG